MNFFHEALFNTSEKVIVLAGGGGKSVLINKFCHELKKTGKTALVLSNYDFFIPPDSNTFISDDASIIKSQLSSEIALNQIVYLGKSFDEKKIKAFKESEIHEIADNVECDHILIEIDSAQGKSLSGFDKLKFNTAKRADRCILVIGADALNQPNNETYIKTNDTYWKQKKILEPTSISDWLVNHKLFKILTTHGIPLSVYINKVENVFHKNLTINFARQT